MMNADETRLQEDYIDLPNTQFNPCALGMNRSILKAKFHMEVWESLVKG